ncbi:hypothetical protein B7R74_20560 [Yersinia pseudotuberculosis]|nr:hypothetical protein B7R74_20560 [Yersinia pseudotuberculosis]
MDSVSIFWLLLTLYLIFFLIATRCVTDIFLLFIFDLMNKTALSTLFLILSQLIIMLFDRKYQSAQFNQISVT